MRFQYIILLTTIVLLFSCAGKSRNDKHDEMYRPQVHFSPEQNWMGYPTGLVYSDGEYHLFYLHNPKNNFWGNIHWSHAVSHDLIHWQQLPMALAPDSLGYILSGSVVVDINNTSGFGTKKNPAFIAFYTYYNSEAKDNLKHSLAMAFSIDKGRTWSKYSKNPIVKNPGIPSFSDPKVFWYAPNKSWIMAVTLGQKIGFYTSTNCKSWAHLSNFGMKDDSQNAIWETPDFFEIKVQGSNETKWVLLVSSRGGSTEQAASTRYFIGSFDGKNFNSESSYIKYNFLMDYGKDCYANNTWNDTLTNRRISIGWMNNWEYTGQEPIKGWSGSTTFPRELSLVKQDSIYTLYSKPIKGIEKLYVKCQTFKDLKVTDSKIISDKIKNGIAPVDIQLVFDNSNNTAINFAQKYGIRLKNKKGEFISIGYDNVDKFFYIDRTNAFGEMSSKSFVTKHSVQYRVDMLFVNWRLIIDKSSVEFFADDYKLAMTDTFYPSDDFDTIELFTDIGSINLKSGSISELNSIWKNKK